MLALVAAEHLLAKRRKILAAELAGQQILLTELDRQLEFASLEALKQCAIARMGVAVLPELVVAAELQRGALVALPWPQKPIYVYT